MTHKILDARHDLPFPGIIIYLHSFYNSRSQLMDSFACSLVNYVSDRSGFLGLAYI